MLETKLDSIKDTCKGYASFHSPPLRMIYMYVVKWMFYHGVDGYIWNDIGSRGHVVNTIWTLQIKEYN